MAIATRQPNDPPHGQIGFSKPSVDAAASFRTILNAVARPGSPQTVAAKTLAAAPLSLAATTALLTLADADAPVWRTPDVWSDATDHLIRFCVGAAPVSHSGQAAFVCGRFGAIEALELPAGSPDYPDRSATLIIETDGFAAEPDALALKLSGPGVDGVALLHVAGFGSAFARFLQQTAAQFPLGVDLLLTHGDQVVGLPRSTKEEVG
ncbi:MAG: phosphonate C-P lyase system protein PhnH [Neomegalonema sp.]